VRLGRLGGVLAALALILLPVAPAAAEGPYPPGIDADTIRIAALTATVAAGGAHSCTLTSIGELYCWGDDSSGQLGDGAVAHAFGQAVLALREVVQVDAGKAHTCAIDVRGTAYCWGDDSAGQLGDGAWTDRDSAVAVTALAGRNLVEITAGARHTCAVDDEGGAWCWGDGSHGQLGVPGLRGSAVPVRVGARSGMRGPVVDIAAGRDTSCAVTAAGAAYCWGSDAYEQLGTGGRGDRDEPVAVAANGPMHGRVREITVGGTQACALGADGQAYCWGTRGLGSGTRRPKAEPVAVDLAAPLGEVTAGGEHTCGLDRGGRAFCWGEGTDGRLGSGRPMARAVPTGVPAGVPLRDLDAGDEHSCAVDTRGYAYCWGAGADGQLGAGSTAASAVPVPVAGLPRPPGSVTGVRVRALDGGLRVDWRPPADLGSGEFAYFWVTTAGYEAGCTLTVASAGGCELTGLRNDRDYDVAVVVRTGDGITVSDFVTGAPAAAAPLPSGVPEPRRMGVSVLAGSTGGLPVAGLSPLALVVLGTLLLGGGLAARLVRRSDRSS
jgi:alpha-tubulin suppressor-like RCC1 family protein